MGHIEETMPNLHIKISKIFKYQVLQLDKSNFKSTGRLIQGKDKKCQTWQYHVGQLAFKMDLQNYKMNSYNESVSQKSRRVKLMELLQHLRR